MGSAAWAQCAQNRRDADFSEQPRPSDDFPDSPTRDSKPQSAPRPPGSYFTYQNTFGA